MHIQTAEGVRQAPSNKLLYDKEKCEIKSRNYNFYIMLFPSKGLHLFDAKYTFNLGLSSILILKSFNKVNFPPSFSFVCSAQASGNCDSVALRTCIRARSAYVSEEPYKKLLPPWLADKTSRK